MASMRDIQRRKNSITSTQQITNAMKLVSTVKLQKTRTRAEKSKPYFDYMYQTVTSMLAKSENMNHRYLKKGDSGKKAILVITSNRGLAGGYNANIVRLVTGCGFDPKEVRLYCLGRKGREALERKGYEVAADYSDIMDDPQFYQAKAVSSQVLEDFEKGEISEIYLAYTVFKNTVVHIPTFMKLLPVEKKEEGAMAEDRNTLMNYEPEAEEALDIIIPKYITSLIYGALTESVASENGARMQAMDSATSNAEEMIADLSLMYNRARQGSITQELTEIIAGAEAIS
jgi:F-type H+-transporting ATPase subunit gamma